VHGRRKGGQSLEGRYRPLEDRVQEENECIAGVKHQMLKEGEKYRLGENQEAVTGTESR